MSMDLKGKRVVVTGGAGFLGRVVCRSLAERGCEEILVPRQAEYDLTHEADVARMYADLRPQVILHLAAEVGGSGPTAPIPAATSSRTWPWPCT